MKLAAKLILIFLFGVLAIVSLFAWQTMRRQHDWEEQRRVTHAGDLAETLAPAIKKAYEEGGTIFIGGLDPAELVSMEEIERRYISHVLEATGNNQTQAARILGLDRKTIYRKLK